MNDQELLDFVKNDILPDEEPVEETIPSSDTILPFLRLQYYSHIYYTLELILTVRKKNFHYQKRFHETRISTKANQKYKITPCASATAIGGTTDYVSI